MGGGYKHSSNYALMFTIKPKDAVTVSGVTLQVKWKILVKKKKKSGPDPAGFNWEISLTQQWLCASGRHRLDNSEKMMV